jgi:hypothetical protein
MMITNKPGEMPSILVLAASIILSVGSSGNRRFTVDHQLKPGLPRYGILERETD